MSPVALGRTGRGAERWWTELDVAPEVRGEDEGVHTHQAAVVKTHQDLITGHHGPAGHVDFIQGNRLEVLRPEDVQHALQIIQAVAFVEGGGVILVGEETPVRGRVEVGRPNQFAVNKVKTRSSVEIGPLLPTNVLAGHGLPMDREHVRGAHQAQDFIAAIIGRGADSFVQRHVRRSRPSGRVGAGAARGAGQRHVAGQDARQKGR